MSSSQCTQCRREGTKLYLKGERCLTSKCPIIRRNFPPGVHGAKGPPRQMSGFGQQLREKQKVKRMFGVRERQFLNVFERASAAKGPTGTLMLQFLERRLDNLLYRAGLASSRSQARQWVSHDFFLVNGEKVNIPSYLCTVGDVITVQERKKGKGPFQDLEKRLERAHTPAWLFVEGKNLQIKMIRIPAEDDLDRSLNMNLIVESFSR